MTSTRMAIVRLGVDIERVQDLHSIVHVVKHRDDRRAPCLHYADYEFPALMFPFKTDAPEDELLSYTGQGNHFAIPVKMFFYVMWMVELANMGKQKELDDITKAVIQLQMFWKLFEDCTRERQDEILQHMKRAYWSHLNLLWKESKKFSDEQGMRISKVALTVPPNWDEWMCRGYVEKVNEIWSTVESNQIFLFSEANAVGHYLIWDQRKRLLDPMPDSILLGDFGGHTFVRAPVRCFNVSH